MTYSLLYSCLPWEYTYTNEHISYSAYALMTRMQTDIDYNGKIFCNKEVFNLRFSLATHSNQFLTGFSQRGFYKISQVTRNAYSANLNFFLETIVKIVLEVQQDVEQQYYGVLMTVKCLQIFRIQKLHFRSQVLNIKHTQLYPGFKTQNSKR